MLCVRKTFYWPPIQNMNMSYLVTWYLYCHTKTLVCTLTAYFRWSFVHDIAAWFVFESWRMANISEGWRYQIGWIFGKIPNSLRPSRLIFGKWYCNFFMTWLWFHICEEIWWLDSIKCMHMISRYRCNTIVIQYYCWKTYPEPWNDYFVSISWSKSPV